MAIIEVSTIVKQNKNKVYNILKNMEEFPKFMLNIKKLEVIERNQNRLVTRWEVDIEGVIVSWKEEDILNDKNCNIKFCMTKGDYHRYEGCWQVDSCSSGSRITLRLLVDWGIPVLGKHVGHVLERKARASLKSMLRAIQNQARNSER